jgi:hypothetical protein
MVGSSQDGQLVKMALWAAQRAGSQSGFPAHACTIPNASTIAATEMNRFMLVSSSDPLGIV